ncbi:unnamed protein product [Phytophthora fragariaefolia]|uniref:Unnamed protein product n=1 Tax=Phytophthora fragariaefolia TaxID=1490495 RepID=A0A9W6XAM5_9STRA|nr:unnamed protein product [Phytophthora fragariaefolia]
MSDTSEFELASSPDSSSEEEATTLPGSRIWNIDFKHMEPISVDIEALARMINYTNATVSSTCTVQQALDEHWKNTVRGTKWGGTALGRGREKVAGRAAAWDREDAVVAKALKQVSWLDIRQLPGATGWSEQTFFRLKLRAFTWWVATRNLPGCPITECQQTLVATEHTFWACPGAKALWRTFARSWTALGLETTASSPENIFSLRLKHVPPKVLQLLDDIMCDEADKEKDATRGQVHTLLQWSWAVGVLTTPQGIWRRRCLYREQLEDTSIHRAEAVIRGRLRSVYHIIRNIATDQNSSPHRHAAAKICLLALTNVTWEGMAVVGPACTTQHTLLFFDGGSRGNPGPGGAGSVILQVGGSKATARILWMASVSYAHKTTNNIAEYHGLLNGLRGRRILHSFPKMVLTRAQARAEIAARPQAAAQEIDGDTEFDDYDDGEIHDAAGDGEIDAANDGEIDAADDGEVIGAAGADCSAALVVVDKMATTSVQALGPSAQYHIAALAQQFLLQT